MNFKEWLLSESFDQVVLMKAVEDQGAASIKRTGLQLQDRHRDAAKYYNKYGDVTTEQLYGPGLYFGIIPNKEYAKNNCKDYAETWGNHIILASIKPGSRGLITGFWPNHPMWKYLVSKEPYIYDQLEALGVRELLGYTKNNVHSDNKWGYKLHDKIDFWAHQHNTRQHVVVYNPSVLQMLDQFECLANKKPIQKIVNTPINNADDMSIDYDLDTLEKNYKATYEKTS